MVSLLNQFQDRRLLTYENFQQCLLKPLKYARKNGACSAQKGRSVSTAPNCPVWFQNWHQMGIVYPRAGRCDSDSSAELLSAPGVNYRI